MVEGEIGIKELLPVTRLNYGRTLLESSSGQHKLGRLLCSGRTQVTTMPTSCRDLWLVGHASSGIYSVKGATQVESVYCDFAKLPDEAGTLLYYNHDRAVT